MKLDYSDKLMKDKYMKDLYRRLGNIVLKVVRDIRIQEEKLDFQTKNYMVVLIGRHVAQDANINNVVVNKLAKPYK